MGELKPPGKPFDISKWEVQEAYLKVRANKGAPGIDEVTLGDFESDLKNNLYKVRLGYAVSRSRLSSWTIRERVRTIRGRLVSSWRGSALTRTALTTWSGCAGRAGLPACAAGMPAAGGWLTGGSSAAAAAGGPR
jgi:hypothetical protein